jgi:hypothetical protein
MPKRGKLRIAIAFAAALMISAIGVDRASADGPDDDWEVVEQPAPSQTANQAAIASTEHRSPIASIAPQNGAQGKIFLACGEPARPAQEPYKSIVASLNQMWGSHAKVYESIAPMSPHASPGGCIFYNTEFLQMLTSRWMGITDDDELRPMLYAINAHELGHLVHGDLTVARAGVPLETKELEADRFAGYTLWRLNVKRFDAEDTERYYQAVGDDFVGAGVSHGTGQQRTTAFQEGWDLARTGAREDSGGRPVGGLD